MRVALILALLFGLVGCATSCSSEKKAEVSQPEPIKQEPKIVETGTVTVMSVLKDGTYQLKDTSNVATIVRFCTPVPDFNPGDQVNITYEDTIATDDRPCGVFQKAQVIYQTPYKDKHE